MVSSQSTLEQHAALRRKLRGHYAYYGMTGNADALGRFLWLAERAWRYWSNRRSKCKNVTRCACAKRVPFRQAYDLALGTGR